MIQEIQFSIKNLIDSILSLSQGTRDFLCERLSPNFGDKNSVRGERFRKGKKII